MKVCLHYTAQCEQKRLFVYIYLTLPKNGRLKKLVLANRINTVYYLSMQITKEQHEELKEKVIEYWDNHGVVCREYNFEWEMPFITDKFLAILDDLFECVNVLGFESIEEYLASAEREV